MIVVVEALDGCILDGPVHAFDLTVGPCAAPAGDALHRREGMVGLGEAVLDPVLVADPIEDVVGRIFVVGMFGEPDAVISEDRMDGVGNRGHQVAQELGCDHLARLLVELGICEL